MENKLPKGWEIKELGAVCKIFVGRDLKENNFSNIKTDKHLFPVYSNTVDNQGLYGYYDFAEYSGNSLTIVGRGAGLGTAFTRNGGFGAIGRLLVLFPLEIACAHYLTEFVNHKLIIHQESGGIPQLTGEQISKYHISLPPLKEQQKIAALLSTWDKAIFTCEALLKKYELRKKGLMQRLLSGKGKDWTEKTIGEVGIISSAGVDKKELKGEKRVRLLNYLDVYRRDFIYNNELNHWVTASDDKIKKCNVLKGDIFFTPSSEVPNDIAVSSVAMENIDLGVYSYHIVRLRLKENWDLKYRAYAFKTDDFFMQAQKLCDGSGQRYVISQDKFRSIKIKVPSIAEQKVIGEILFTADQEISLLKSKVKKLKEQKKGLMQVLLTGRKRLRINEI